MYIDILPCQFLHNNKAATIKELLSKALKKSCFLKYLQSCGTINDLRSTLFLNMQCILSSQQLLMLCENVV